MVVWVPPIEIYMEPVISIAHSLSKATFEVVGLGSFDLGL